MSTIKVNNITTYTGSYIQVAKDMDVTGTLRASSNISGTLDLTVNRVSGSERGMTTCGPAIFSNTTSIKASGSITSATTISGAASVSAASLTINGTERISQNGNAIFVALTADTLDVREINNTSVTTNTLEVADKLVIVASGSNASNTNQAGLQFGGTDGSNAISSILWNNSDSRLSSSTAFFVGGAFAAQTTITAAGNITGAADLTVNRISGSERGTTLLGPVVLSNTTSSLIVSGNVGIGQVPVQKLHVNGLISGSALQTKNNIIASGSITAVGDVTVGDDLILSSDDAAIKFGADGDVELIHENNYGLKLKCVSGPPVLYPTFLFQPGDTLLTAGEPLGRISFQSPNHIYGGDDALVAATIEAVAESAFKSTNNATKLVFKTAESEAASEKMSLSSAGNLTVNSAGIFGGGTSNAQTINTTTLPANYNSVLYGPITIDSGDSFTISAGSNVKIINIADV